MAKYLTRTVVSTKATAFIGAVKNGKSTIDEKEYTFSGKLDEVSAEKELKKATKKDGVNYIGLSSLVYDEHLYRCTVEAFMKIAEEIKKEEAAE